MGSWVRRPPVQRLTCSRQLVAESESLQISTLVFWFTNQPWVTLSGMSCSPVALTHEPTRP